MAAALRLPGLTDLLREWRLRLASLRRSLADAPASERWIVEIRVRILTFLLSRYEDRTEPAPVVHDHRAANDDIHNSRFDLPEITPEYRGPRTSHLAPRLRDIQQQRRSMPRRRFWP